jgi:hypothetical protein
MADVIEKWGRTHKNAPQAIGLDLIGQLRQFAISPELLPSSEMLLVLGLKFNCSLHGVFSSCSLVYITDGNDEVINHNQRLIGYRFVTLGSDISFFD